MNAIALRAIVAVWLRYHRECPLVVFERGLNWLDRPDVLALTRHRFLLEVEIKVSARDFHRDKDKWKWRRPGGTSHIPQFFYYLAPFDLALRIQADLPEGAGLLTVSNPERLNSYSHLPDIACLVRPKKNPVARKVRVREALELVKHQTGTLCSLAAAEACISLESISTPRKVAS